MKKNPRDFIYIKDNAIKEQHCDKIIKLLNDSKLDIQSFYNGLAVNPFDQEWFNDYVNCLNFYKKKHKFLNENISFWKTDLACNYQKYEINQNYNKEHCEHIPNYSKRILVWMFYCNSIKNGGETIFPQQKIKIKPKKSRLIIWPAAWTHSHYGAPCKENKYIVTGWCSYI